MEYKHFQDSAASSGTNHLVEKVRNSNINCDSPFRLLPIISTPPSRIFKIRNPFESPLLERLHLPVCSPGLFANATPKRDEKFLWSICDISHLKPAEIDTNCYQENICTTLDPQTESVIQDKISTFFRLNAVVPSPAPREANEFKHENPILQENSRHKKDSLSTKKLNTVSDSTPAVHHSIIGNNISGSEMDIHNISDDKAQYLPEEVYYKKLFEFESQAPETSPSISPLDSPVQFSPLQKLEVKSFSDEMDKKSFNDCVLSPITPEDETSQKENSKNMSTRESKSACRLVFSDNLLAEEKDNSAYDFDLSLDDTVTETEFFSKNTSDENSGLMSIDEVFHGYEDEKMDISLVHTPKTGLFTSPRKRLSDSFKELHGSFSHTEEISEFNSQNIVTKSGFLPEGSSDLGYHSANVVSGPSMTENTWNSSHVFSSTPTKRKK